jgi:acetoin:2,6-dichlorophenolindophenol oxidoreductase subunit alpha
VSQMDVELKLRAYAVMVTSREIDIRCKRLLADGYPVPNYHSGIGQEAMSTGVGLAAAPDDYLMFTYRDFGMLLAKGVPAVELVGDLLLKAAGTTGGHGGIMHVVSPKLGIVGRNGVFGSRFGIALGLAMAAQQLGEPRVVICAFGEAEGTRGPLYEAINIACLRRLPVVFVAENNGFSISSRTSEIYAPGNMVDMFRGAPLPVSRIDGNDADAVFHATAGALEHSRAGLGPFFLEFKTYRIDPHIPIDDDSKYRTSEEIDLWRRRDPIKLFGDRLRATKVASDEQLVQLQSSAATELDEAFETAMNAPDPDLQSLRNYLYYPAGSWGNGRGSHGD